MGFRSTLTTEDYSGTELPKWFTDKYQDYFYFGGKDKPTLYLASKYEIKTYGDTGLNLPEDLQKLCKEKEVESFVAVWLHECGGITRLEVTPDGFTYSEPIEWKITDQVEHDYCYGCSDVERVPKK